MFMCITVPTLHASEYDDIDILTNYDVQFAALSESANSGNLPQPHQKQGYSQGSSLRSIAEGSNSAANMAVNNQDAAGHQAAYVAKNTLAQSAAAASATAQAALAGKQILLQGLEQQYRDAQQALMSERQQLMQAQRAADSTQRASAEANQHVNVLQNTLNAAQAAAQTVTQAANEAAGELAAQQAMVGSAMDRLEQIGKQLAAVRIDFEATRTAAQQAQAAARRGCERSSCGLLPPRRIWLRPHRPHNQPCPHRAVVVVVAKVDITLLKDHTMNKIQIHTNLFCMEKIKRTH
ncbi:hypothetical protein NQ317_010593 [Molorchus minor]|uniref:Uncharacterized protein n=1 Tax=Molorchus minor TaxID=1323400 RepID=A0ABQ9JQZ3_9CUCU|nr:hypothetical protein NQ317_010593 [Molorchus minor]